MRDQLPEAKTIRVFVASPGDVLRERGLVRKILEDLNLERTAGRNVRFECVSWETHVRPGMGRPQDVINRQLPPCEIFIGVMWNRFGTPTGVFGSGTEEEFQIAYGQWALTGSPQIFFYFCDKPSTATADQREEVRAFRKSLEDKQGLVWGYKSSKDFTSAVRRHLIFAADELVNNPGNGEKSPGPEPDDGQGDPKRFTAFLASVRDLYEPVRAKIIDGLSAEDIKVILPGEGGEPNEQLIAKSDLSIHLIDGDFNSKVNEQLDQGCKSAQKQIVWLSHRVDLASNDLNAYHQSLRALKDREEDNFELMQCRDAAKSIIDRVKKLKSEWLEGNSRRIFFNIRRSDKSLAQDVFEYLYEKKKIEPLMNSDDAGLPTLQEFDEKARQSRAIVVFFGYVDVEWVKWQLMEVVKVVFTKKHPIGRFGVYVAPPPEDEKSEPIVLPGGFRPLWMDNTKGFDHRTVDALCDALFS